LRLSIECGSREDDDPFQLPASSSKMATKRKARSRGPSSLTGDKAALY
jgi:hypothetical protein